jgi:hypothetical protein
MRTNWLAALIVAATLMMSTAAQAKHVRFLGPHPCPARYGGGYCYIDAPHIHAYAPDKTTLYQQVGDQYVFTGDPTPYGYDGERHAFYGHHPIVTETGEPVYCVIDGPHYHPFAAPATPDFKVKSDVAFYIGPPLPVPQAHVRLVNAAVRPYVQYRPAVTVEPPPEYHAEVWVAPPGVTLGVSPPPEVTVEAPEPPSVTVAAPVAPSVVVSAPRPHVSVEVIAPPPPSFVVEPPSATVVVGVPAPPGIYVGAPAPRAVVVGSPGVFVGGPRGHWEGHRERENDQGENGRWHHDNGRHNGWGKHGR